jgi:hypothetical protein
VVVSSRAAPTDKCTAALFDRDILREYGSISLRMQGMHAEISAARPPGYRRPWAESPQRKAARQQPDATPPLNRLDPSDY